MNKKNLSISVILIFILTLAGCSISKKVRTHEIKEFTKSLLESNEKVISLKFNFRRPSLYADIVYKSDLEKEDFQYLIDEFKTLIDIDFMQKIGDKYWNGERPNSFILSIDIGKEDKNSYDYEIYSYYNKTKMSNEELENIDGYETWYIKDIDHNEIILD